MLTLLVTFDREVQDRHYASVICLDHGDRPLASTANVVVKIADVNDHDPYFIWSSQDVHLPLKLFVSENSPVGTSVGHVAAYDEDIHENGRVEYRVTSWASLDAPIGGFGGHSDAQIPLVAVSDNGDILTTAAIFDHELAKTYSFEIIAVDHGLPPAGRRRSAPIQVLLTVLDVDDEQPEFTADQYVFSVFENLPSGAVVGRVTATDKDSPPHDLFTYALRGVDEDEDAFTVDAETGVITMRRELDREAQDRYHILVYAIPSLIGSNSACNSSSELNLTHPVMLQNSTKAIVQISVLDVNDNPPWFLEMSQMSGDFTVRVSRHSAIGCVVTRLHASDNDMGVNAMIIYSIVNVSLVENEQRIDFAMIVKSDDKKYSGERNVTPISYSTVDREGSMLGHLLRNVSEAFSMNPDNGELVVTAQLTGLTAVSSVHLTCLVSDNGHPRRLTTSTVLTLILDSHAPACLRHTIDGQFATRSNDVLVKVVIVTSLVLVTLVMLMTCVVSVHQQNLCNTKKSETIESAAI